MSFFRRWLDRFKTKATTTDTGGWFVDWMRGGTSSQAGIAVSSTSAQRCAAVFACVEVVSQDVAKTALPLYRQLRNGDRERVTNHPLYDLISVAPNGWQTSFEWRHMMQGHVELRGNAYSYVERDGRGRPLALWPMHPDCVTVLLGQDGRSLYYEYREPAALGGETHRFPQADVLHIRTRAEDGIHGLSRISLGREAIGLALAMEQHGAKLFANGALFTGVLQTDKQFTTQEEADRARELFAARYTGNENMWKPALLHNGLKWQQMSMTADDAQFIEARVGQVVEVARLFRVPPHMIAELSRSTFSNIEHQSIEYVVGSLLPRFAAFEQRLNATLLGAGDLYFEFLADSLLRGDQQSRYAAYGMARQWGIMSVNDIRRLENMPNIGAQGDIYLQPGNMIDASKPPPVAAPPAPTPPAPTDQSAPPSEDTLRLMRAWIDARLASPAPQRLNGKEGHGHA
jgi:HK97 family phage portal protein